MGNSLSNITDIESIKPINELSLPPLYNGVIEPPIHPMQLLTSHIGFGAEHNFDGFGLRYCIDEMDILDKYIPEILLQLDIPTMAKLVDVITWANTGNYNWEIKEKQHDMKSENNIIDFLSNGKLNATAIGNIAYFAHMSPHKDIKDYYTNTINILKEKAKEMPRNVGNLPFLN